VMIRMVMLDLIRSARQSQRVRGRMDMFESDLHHRHYLGAIKNSVVSVVFIFSQMIRSFPVGVCS